MLKVGFKKDIAPLALPMFLGMVVFQVQAIINRAFLGRLAVEYLAVIGNVVFPMWTTMAMLNSLTTGATILMSQRIGAGDEQGARSFAASALKWNGVLALALFAFWSLCSGPVYSLMGVSGTTLAFCVRYTKAAAFSFLFSGLNSALTAIFQASGRTRPLMYAGAFKSLLNILLDWLLIFGSLGFPRLEVQGAAIAGVICDAVGTLLLGLFLVRDRSLRTKPSLRDILSSRLVSFGAIAKMGMPTSLEDLMWNIGNLFLIRFLNMLDPLATAVYSLVFTIQILPIVVFTALGQTTTVLVGQAKGAGDLVRAKGAAFTAQLAAVAASIAIAAVFLLVPGPIVGVFTSDPSIGTRIVPILVIVCCTFLPRSINFIAGSGIRGTGDTKWMLATQVFGTVFIVALGWLLIFRAGLGVPGLYFALLADESVRAIANGLRFGTKVRSVKTLRPAVYCLDGARSSGEGNIADESSAVLEAQRPL